MLAILNEMAKWRNEETGEFELDSFKIVYVAPMKALVQEQVGNFSHRLSKFGISRRSVRWILGNPLIAITMIRHDISAGLFAPVELLLTEAEDGQGTTVTYVRPSTLMAIEQNPPLLDAARVLDEKCDALVAGATTS